jgi:pimeloyl-ACP methyl ester carboxylesterase
MKIRNLLFALFFLGSTTGIAAQPVNKFTGIWEGKLNLGVELRIVFHIKEDGKGGLLSTADSPDQAAYGLKCDSTSLNADAITIEMHDLKASFTGKLLNDSTIVGVFTQLADVPLILKKVDKPSELKRNRPQTPQPPFPYKSEDLEYDNADKSLHYGATITIPEGNGPFPAAVMITGSGAQNRDEEIMGHKLFAVIADYLTRKGFIILRVDDRGVGKSSGKFSEATSADFAKDVNAGVDYLLSRPEVDRKKLGLIGHSEGGMIAPMVATQRQDINFIVLLAGPGVKITELMAGQNAAVLRSAGISQKAVEAYIPLYKEMTRQIIRASDTMIALAAVKKTMSDWITHTDAALVKELDMQDAGKRDAIAVNLVQAMSSPWYKYFLSFDPEVYLEKLKCRVLAINGDKDIQVISGQNLSGIEASLKKSKVNHYTIKEIPGLNHLFQSCKKCTVQEYGELEETFSPIALQIIGEWLEKNVK